MLLPTSIDGLHPLHRETVIRLCPTTSVRDYGQYGSNHAA
jgi:hypothetical protein